MSTYTPTGDRIFVRPDPMPEASASGLIDLSQLEKRPAFTGKVVALGEGPVTKKGIVLPHFVSLGDRIMFSPSTGQELFFEDEVIIVMREEDVLAIIDKDVEVERG